MGYACRAEWHPWLSGRQVAGRQSSGDLVSDMIALRIWVRCIAAGALLLLAAGLSAPPALADDAATCRNDNAASDQRIEACTRLIQAKKSVDKSLAPVFTKRGLSYYRKSDYDRAIADCNEALRLDPQFAEAFTVRGDSYLWKGDYDRAFSDLNEGVRLAPKAAWTFNDRGRAYEEKGDYDRALGDFNKAIELDPKFSWPLGNRANVYRLKGDPDRAIKDSTAAIQLAPKYSDGFNIRGLAYHVKGDDDRAIADYNAAIKLDPMFSYAFSNRGNAYRSKGDFDRAISDCNEATRLDPRNADAFYFRGLVYATKGDYDRAVSEYSEALRIAPKFVAAFSNRGAAYFFTKDYDRALADGNEAIRLNPKDWGAFNVRGLAYRLKGDRDHAMADFNEAIRLAPGKPYPLGNRGTVYEDKGDDGSALEDYSAAIRADPNWVWGYANRGALYAKRNDVAHARADFEAALALTPRDFDQRQGQDRARTLLAALPPAPAALAAMPAAAPVVSAAPVAVAPTKQAVQAVAATPGRRIALVIGNSKYASLRALPNPRNDADDIARVLKTLGFEVTLGTDLKRTEMEEALIRFAREARGSRTALVFYSGHGIQYQGENYLLPIDARIEDESDLRRLIKLQDVIGDLQNASDVRILIVDACRDNEAVQQVAARLPAPRAAAMNRGLSRMADADGTLVVFATQPNRVAADGPGRNSPFTQALLKHMPTPGVELRTLMTRVRADVVAATNGTQRPELSDSLVGEFVFKASP